MVNVNTMGCPGATGVSGGAGLPKGTELAVAEYGLNAAALIPSDAALSLFFITPCTDVGASDRILFVAGLAFTREANAFRAAAIELFGA